MGIYQILKLDNDQFDFLVIATSYENPLSHIDEILAKIKVEHAKILFDLTLLNGIKSNRYVLCNFKLNDNYLQACSTVKDVSENIMNISHNYFINNQDVISKSVMPAPLKFLLQSGTL